MALTARVLLILTLTIAFTHCSTFDIISVSSCTTFAQNGACTRWEQNGTVIETTGCFPAETEVFVLEDGQNVIKRMDQLKIGDSLLSLV